MKEIRTGLVDGSNKHRTFSLFMSHVKPKVNIDLFFKFSFFRNTFENAYLLFGNIVFKRQGGDMCLSGLCVFVK